MSHEYFRIGYERGNTDNSVAIILGAAKSNPLKLFAVFSATVRNFCVKFYAFT